MRASGIGTAVCVCMLLVAFCREGYARDDAGQLVSAGFGLLNQAVNSVSKSNANKQQTAQSAKQESQISDQGRINNANAQNPGPSFSKDDISNLLSKIKTNVSIGDMMGVMNSPLHLIALQTPDIKFGQFFCLCGEGQLSLEQKRKIFGGSVVDPIGKWQTKIISFNKTNEDTLAIELDLMMRNDPTESPKPSRRIFYFRYTSPGDTIYLIQIKAFGTKQGDIMINSDGASGYIGEQVFYTFYEGVMLFLTSGQYQFNGS